MLLLASATSPSGGQPRAEASRVVYVVAERFVFTPSEITVEEGTLLELRITSEDTDHGFHLFGPDEIDVEIPKRGRGEIRVNVDAREPGVYIFECSRICGAGHSFMRGTLRVRARAPAETGRAGTKQ